MIIYDGIFQWDGKQRGKNPPVCWWPGKYHIRIIRFKTEHPDIVFMKDHAVLCRNLGKGASIENYAQNFARRVSEKHDLKMEKTLWVEILNHPPGKIRVAGMGRGGNLSGQKLYTPNWRDILPNEKTMLASYIEDFLSAPPEVPPLNG